MALEKYNRKRNFKDTPEPEGKPEKAKGKLIFVVQRHEASRLHYDFRLEADSVLKSWAVPKGPSLNPADKRLAVQVEDHPVSYAVFQGDIPEGNYGAGHVDIWDSGTYEPENEAGNPADEKDFLKQLEAGNAKFRLHGKKLKGSFALVQMKGRGEKNWLLIKHKDEFSQTEPYDIENEGKAARQPTVSAPEKAVKKKISRKIPAENEQPADTPDEAIDKKFTDFIRPMMAKIHESPFDNPGWLFEIKWDGYRAIAEVNGEKTRLYSRNGLSFQQKYPAVYNALKEIKEPMILDGEIVAFNKKGLPDFQLLQQYGMDGKAPLAYYVFDILSLRGKMLENKPLAERKKILKSVLKENELIRYCDHVEGEGKIFFEVVEQRGMEGMIAKKADSRYYEDRRTSDWLKVKRVQSEEAIICGYTAPRGQRKYFGSLILGMYIKDKLEYIGHSGTGFNHKSLKQLYEVFRKYRSDKSPFDKKIPVKVPVTWLLPELVCNIKYSEITRAGIRRHPVFLGLRIDKSSEEISMEKQDITDKQAAGKEKPKQKKGKIIITHPEKIYFPGEKITKGEVIDYYNKIAPFILKYQKDRPQSLKRNPNGIKDKGFYQKDLGNSVPEWIDTYKDWAESAGKEVNYIVCNNKDTLLYMANLGCIEINPWNARTQSPENPDYMVLDLDPSEENSFDQVIEAAQAIHEILEKAGCAGYCKTSGATGLHVYIPLNARYDFDQVRIFAEIIAKLTNEKLPDFTSLERSLDKRGPNIYIDYMQNKTGQTLSSAYSLRPRPGAPVSTPLEWKEVKPGLDPEQFHLRNIQDRLKRKGDLFEPVLGKGVDLETVLKNLGA